MSTPSIRRLVEEHGGIVSDSAHGVSADFPDAAPDQHSTAAEVEAAVDRAIEYGTACHPLWRQRGEGWYVAESREEHPGFWYVCQLDERTGQPISCECAAALACHHLGAAIRLWRQRVGYEANGAAALADWEETLKRIRAQRPTVVMEEWV